jgi:hypothetical protein
MKNWKALDCGIIPVRFLMPRDIIIPWFDLNLLASTRVPFLAAGKATVCLSSAFRLK